MILLLVWKKTCNLFLLFWCRTNLVPLLPRKRHPWWNFCAKVAQFDSIYGHHRLDARKSSKKRWSARNISNSRCILDGQFSLKFWRIWYALFNKIFGWYDGGTINICWFWYYSGLQLPKMDDYIDTASLWWLITTLRKWNIWLFCVNMLVWYDFRYFDFSDLVFWAATVWMQQAVDNNQSLSRYDSSIAGAVGSGINEGYYCLF